MSPSAPTPEPATPPEPRFPSLRARLWIGALGGAVMAALAVACVIAAIVMMGAAWDVSTVALALVASAAIGVLAALLFAQWLERGVMSGMRRLLHAMASGQAPDPRDLEQSVEWGEIGRALVRLHAQQQQQRALGRAGAELQLTRAEAQRWSEALERWMATERWQPVESTAPTLAPLAETLNRALAREHSVMDRNREAARAVGADILTTLQDARAAAGEAEHEFIESNALLTTVREIARVGAELQLVAATPPPSPAPAAPDRSAEWRRRAAESLESLVTVSSESVEHLGNGLMRVQEVGVQVQLLSNRATLIALNALLAGGTRPGDPQESADWAADLKQLAREVRAATERIAELAADVALDVEAANTRMHEARDQMMRALEAEVEPSREPAPPAAAPPSADLTRLGERLREMVQDALRKGERLSEAGERASRAAERLVRRLEDQSRDLDGLVARLTPTGDATPPAPPAGPAPGSSEAETGGPRLRLFAPGTERPESGERRGRGERS